MTLFEKLKNTGLRVEYGFIDEDNPETPFLIYYFSEPSHFKADDKIYNKENHYTIEHYFKTKNLEIEEKIENALDELEIIYEKSGDIYIDSEEVFINYYYC